ncbi:hypothetical protein V1498_18920 [Peribacillus sp. SCS-26]|uniref:hypothetical protein n=1 Tax=Paraperibacillus marinus TaxID=3115295 RepID=UPI003906A870
MKKGLFIILLCFFLAVCKQKRDEVSQNIRDEGIHLIKEKFTTSIVKCYPNLEDIFGSLNLSEENIEQGYIAAVAGVNEEREVASTSKADTLMKQT